MSETNIGRSIESEEHYYNKCFMIVKYTTIGPGWSVIKSKINTALSAPSSDPSIDENSSFEEWLTVAVNHYSLFASKASLSQEWTAKKAISENTINEHDSDIEKSEKLALNAAVEKFNRKNPKVSSNVPSLNKSKSDGISEQQDIDQSTIARDVIKWPLGDFTDPRMIEGYEEEFEKRAKVLRKLRTDKNKFSTNKVGSLRSFYDCHQYWFYHIKPYEGLEGTKIAIPPRPVEKGFGINSTTLEGIHQLDKMLNILLVMLPDFDFAFVKEFIPKEKLNELLLNSENEPQTFEEFKSFMVNELLAYRVENKFHEESQQNFYRQLTFLRLSIHWVKDYCDTDWKSALRAVYEGKIKDLFDVLIKACLAGVKIRKKIAKQLIDYKNNYLEELYGSAGIIFSFLKANHFLLSQEGEGKFHKDSSEYTRILFQVINISKAKRSEQVSKQKGQKIDTYKRLRESAPQLKRALVFVFYYSDMEARYHHWFTSEEEKSKAILNRDNKLNYADIETGNSSVEPDYDDPEVAMELFDGESDVDSEIISTINSDEPEMDQSKKSDIDNTERNFSQTGFDSNFTLKQKDEEDIVQAIQYLLFSFVDTDQSIQQHKNIIAVLIAYQHDYNQGGDSDITYYYEQAIDAQFQLYQIEQPSELSESIEQVLILLDKNYPLKGFSTLKADVIAKINKIPALIESVKQSS
jgi:hypothetical protein